LRANPEPLRLINMNRETINDALGLAGKLLQNHQ
jgi:hypothetical protein